MASSVIVWMKRWGIPIALSMGALGLGQYIRVSSAQDAHYLTDVQATQLRQVQVIGHRVSLSISNHGGTWKWDGQPNKQVDQIAIQEWIDRVRSVEIIREVRGVSDADAGLDHPTFTVTWVDHAGRSETLLLGGKTPSGEVYLKKGNQVVLVSEIQATLIRVDEMMLRNRYPFKSQPILQVVRVRAETPTARYQLVQTPVSGWWWVVPNKGKPHLADPVSVTRYLQIVNGLSIQSFQTPTPDGIAWRVTFHTPTQAVAIVCQALPDASTGILLDSGEWGLTSPAFRLAGLGFETWMLGAKPVRLDRFALTQVSVTTSKNRVELIRNEAGHWMESASQPPRTTALHNLFSGLADLEITQNSRAGATFDGIELKVQSDRGVEGYRIVQTQRNVMVLTPMDGPFAGQTVTLSGDVERVWRAIHKLTITQ